MQQNVAEALQIFHSIATSGELWPGFQPAKTPLVLVGPEEAWLIGHPAPPDGYAAQAGICGRSVHVGPRPPTMAANTSGEVFGVLCAMAMLPAAGDDATVFARLLLHECFHAFQTTGLQRVPKPDVRAMAHYPENDPVHNAMARVENQLLIEALSGDPEAPAKFVAVRLARQEGLTDAVRAYEVLQEYNEGTPTYIEVRAGKPVPEVEARLRACNVGGKWASNVRFYQTGCALALLLDRAAPGWKAALADQGGTLQGLFQDAVGPDLPAAADVLDAAGYGDLLEAERDRERVRQEQLAAQLAALEGPGPGCRVEIAIGQAPGCMWDPSTVIVVDPGRRLHPRIFGVSGPGIRVEMTGPCLEDRNRQLATLRLPAPPVVTSTAPFQFAGAGLKGEAPTGTLEQVGLSHWRIRLGETAY